MCHAGIFVSFRLGFFCFFIVVTWELVRLVILYHVGSMILVSIIQVVLLAIMLPSQRTLLVQAEHQKASCLPELPKNRRVISQNLIAMENYYLVIIMMIISG